PTPGIHRCAAGGWARSCRASVGQAAAVGEPWFEFYLGSCARLNSWDFGVSHRRASMRFVTYQADGGARLGVVQGDGVLSLPGLDILGIIEAGPAGFDPVWTAGGQALKLADLHLLAPIPTPRRNIFCVGLNYFKHGVEGAEARGAKFVAPEKPVFFTKATLAVNGPYGDIPVDDKVSAEMDWEAELAFVIGRTGKNIPAD